MPKLAGRGAKSIIREGSTFEKFFNIRDHISPVLKVLFLQTNKSLEQKLHQLDRVEEKVFRPVYRKYEFIVNHFSPFEEIEVDKFLFLEKHS